MTHETQGSGQMEDGVFVVLVIIISLAFALVVEPFFGAILWAIIATDPANPAAQSWPLRQSLQQSP